MKRMNILMLIFLTSLFWACEKQDPITKPPVEEEKVFELEWATRMDFEKEIVNLNNGQQYREWYIYSGDLGDPSTIFAFNKETGDKDWEIGLNQLTGTEIDKSFVWENIFIAENSSQVFGYNLDNMELIWEQDFKSEGLLIGRGFLAPTGNYYQTAILNFDPSGGGTQKIFEIDVMTGENREIFSFSPDSIGSKTISPPVIWEDQENGRTLMIFNYRPNAATPPQETRQEIWAMDIDTKEIVWNTNVNNGFASNGLHPPIIYNDIVITGGDWHMYAFDIKTGEQVWKTEISDDSPFSIFTKTNHLIHDSRLYVNENGENVTCLNPETGDIIWNNPKGGPNCTDNMVYYEKEDLLVFTSWGYGSVMVLDALTGETLHREHHYEESQYNNDVVYDEVRDMFFTSTYKHAVGFKVQRIE